MSYSTEVLADNPLLYWQLDDASGSVVADSSSNSRPGTVSGAWNFQQPPHANTSLYGITSGGGAIVSPAVAFGSSDVTVEIWAYIDPSQTYMPFSFGVNYLDLFVTNGRIGVNTGTGDQYGCSIDGGYHHIVAVMPNAKATTSTVLYIDGVQKTLSGASGIAPSLASVTFQVGGWSANSSYRIPNGYYVDEIAVYSGALSGARVLAHYNAGAVPSSAQVEALYTESLVLGTPNSRVEALYVESLVLGSPKGQVESVYVETLVPALMNRRIGWGVLA